MGEWSSKVEGWGYEVKEWEDEVGVVDGDDHSQVMHVVTSTPAFGLCCCVAHAAALCHDTTDTRPSLGSHCCNDVDISNAVTCFKE